MADGNVIIPNAAASLQALKNELRCAMCNSYFTHAVTLSCSHTFCLRCISNWLVVQLVCPTCREDTCSITPSQSLDNMVARLLDATNQQHSIPENLRNANTSHTECRRLLENLTAYVEAFSKYCMHEELDEIMLQHFQIVQGDRDEQEAELEAEVENEEHEEQAQEEYEEEQEEEYEENMYYVVDEWNEEDEEENSENMEYQDDDEHYGETYREWDYVLREYKMES